ncbi:MAG: DEAD/DEAH box helicase [Victivallales bacterium]|nr:DEAD/DEAH box helicase [Victivallales bacterium]
MAAKVAVKHPDRPPEWFDRWPGTASHRNLFKPGIRQYGRRAAEAKPREFKWLPDGLRLNLGDQVATWRMREGQWSPSCTCGYGEGRCPHAYAACLLFDIVAQEEGWSGDGGLPTSRLLRMAARRGRAPKKQPTLPKLAVPAPGSAPEGAAEPVPEPPPENAAEDTAKGEAGNTANGKAGNKAGEQNGRRKQQGKSRGQGQKRSSAIPKNTTLEVEADFQHEDDNVAIRVYQRREGERSLMRMQSLHNLCLRAQRGDRRTAKLPDLDRRFLRWLAPQLRRRRGEMRQNLLLLKLTRGEFSRWLEAWADSPGRFLERNSQAFLTPDGTQPARMVIELRDDGEWVEIAPVVVAPNGTRADLPDVFRQLAEGKGNVVMDGHLLEFTPPISWEVIRKAFMKKVPRMKREHVAKHLPALLDGRLDIVEGKCVERHRADAPRIFLEARPAGADIMVRATVGGKPLTANAAGVSGRIRQKRSKFVITLLDGAGLRQVRRLLRDLGEPTPEGKVRVSGDPACIEKFVKGWRRLPNDVKRRSDPNLRGLLSGASTVKPTVVVREEGNFVDLQVAWTCRGIRIEQRELRDAVARSCSVFRTARGEWVSIDREKTAQVMAELDATNLLGEDRTSRQFRGAARKSLNRLIETLGAEISRSCKSLADRLIAEPDPELPVLDERLSTILRPYQCEGFEFLADRAASGVGAILADDMGLGKTLQALALIDALAREGECKKALVVCPASVMGVWMEQADQFCPELRCTTYRGPAERRHEVLKSGDWQVLVMNYALLRMDVEVLMQQEFDLVILDEAQYIKNPDAQVTLAAKAIKAKRTLALTGTPLENRLLDLWSIMDFLNPSFLGPKDLFMARFEGPHGLSRLAERIAPVILRRTKEAVAPELPPRTEEVIHIDLPLAQRKIYDQQLAKARHSLKTRGPIEILASITRLRQICCHPMLVDEVFAAGSAKLDTLVEMLEEIVAGGHSALVFSQFTSMLDLVREALATAEIPTMTITGETPTHRRGELVREFNESPHENVFLLSLRAAGTGLTLTRADYVFLYDPWWNPAVERQAIDRTHRIGQDKPVFAYRLVAAETVEEKVLFMQEQKAELFDEVLGGAESRGMPSRLTASDLRSLLE